MSRTFSSLAMLNVSAFLVTLGVHAVSITVPILAYVMKASPFLIGLIGAFGGVSYAVLALFFGPISDRFSRRKLLFVGGVIQASAMLIFLTSQDLYQLILASFVFSIGTALYYPLSVAYVGDRTVQDQLGKALRNYNVSWSMATMIGPQLGGLLIAWFSVRTPFFIAFTVLLFAGALLLSTKETNVDRSFHEPHLNELVIPVQVNPKLLPLICVFVFTFNLAILYALFPAYATQLGVSADLIGSLFLLSGLFRTLTFFSAPVLQSKLSWRNILLLSSILFTFSSTILGLVSEMSLFFVAFTLIGISDGASYSTATMIILGGSGSRRGKAAGMMEGTLGLAFFVGPLVGGALYQIGGSCPYFFGAFLNLLTLATLLLIGAKS